MAGKKQHHEDEHIDESWLVPYADILTLLLALFIVLFASSTIDAKKYNAMRDAFNQAFTGGTGILEKEAPNTGSPKMTTTGKEVIELQQIQKQVNQYVQQKNMEKELETRLDKDTLIITIREHALFDSGSATIKDEAKDTLASIADMFLQHPDFQVLVSGHTDNVPINNSQFESNWDLSTERALNILKLLLKNKKLDPRNFSAIGYAEYRPITSNESEDERAKNRRVELAVKKKT